MTGRPQQYKQVRVTVTYDIEVAVPEDGWWLTNVDLAALDPNTMTSADMRVVDA